jgi:Cu-Zn family superoxide dismutase
MNKGIKGALTTIAIAGALAATGCKTHTGRHAVAELNPASGSNTRGMVHFYETSKGVRVVARVTGLTPGQHGFHIHDKGDCSAPDASSAGGHYNPTSSKHGGPNDVERHVGDFGNLEANASGVAKVEFVSDRLKFDGPQSIIGKGVIVHDQPDDLKTQNPPGNAGKRVACGNIQVR